jgi:nucleoside-diphosphate-sugar epimerase
MTFTALKKKKIFVDGGSQIRPQVHIKDMLNVYDFFIKKNLTGIFNVGFENISIIEVAKLIKKVVKNVDIKIKRKVDPRSYRLYAGKLLKSGFKNKYKVYDAIKELQNKFIERKLKHNEKSSRTLFLKKKLSK